MPSSEVQSNVQGATPVSVAAIPAVVDTRTRPWKAHWPAKTSVEGASYGFAKGEMVAIYGN